MDSLTDLEDPKPEGETLSWEEFREALARAEMSAGKKNGGYSEYNDRSKAIDRYQLKPDTLLEAKWKIGDTWTDKARAYGVASDEDFKNNPAAQEAALADAMKDYERQIRGKKLLPHVGQTYNGVAGGSVTITEAGLVAAAHAEGPGGTSSYLRRRVNGRLAENPLDRQRDERVEKRLRDFATIPYRFGQR